MSYPLLGHSHLRDLELKRFRVMYEIIHPKHWATVIIIPLERCKTSDDNRQ